MICAVTLSISSTFNLRTCYKYVACTADKMQNSLDF